MSANLNTYGNCDSEGKGSGSIGCDKSSWGDLKGFALLRKGLFFAVTAGVAALDGTIWDAQIDGLKLFPYLGANDYDSTPGANEINTSTIQVKREIRSGLPEISFMYIDGNCRHASLWDKKGFKRWDVVLIYANGIRMAHNFDLSRVMGFNAGMFTVETETIQKGSDLQMSKCTFQLLDADEFAVRNAFFTWQELGFDAREKDGFNDLALFVDPISPGTEITAAVRSTCNASVNVNSLDEAANWQIVGTVATPTTVSAAVWNPATNKMEFEVSPALVPGDKPKLATKGGATYVATDVLGAKYKGISPEITVGANIPVITSPAEADGQIGVVFNYEIEATNTPTSYAVVGVMPGGLSLNTSTGVISGTPTGSANIRYAELQAINAAGTGSLVVKFDIAAA